MEWKQMDEMEEKGGMDWIGLDWIGMEWNGMEWKKRAAYEFNSFEGPLRSAGCVMCMLKYFINY